MTGAVTARSTTSVAMRRSRIRDLAARIGKIVGVDLDIRPGDAPAGGTRRRCPDISKMRALGWSLDVGLDEGLERTVAWYREHRDDVPANDLM